MSVSCFLLSAAYDNKDRKEEEETERLMDQVLAQGAVLEPEEVLYMGDDIPDMPVMKLCGCSVCPADAVDEVKEIADYISPKGGGKGCARDAIEKTMKLQGTWVLDVAEYKAKF